MVSTLGFFDFALDRRRDQGLVRSLLAVSLGSSLPVPNS